MADAVSTQVLLDGERQYIAKFTNISDGTGESKVTKIDVSALAPNSFGSPTLRRGIVETTFEKEGLDAANFCKRSVFVYPGITLFTVIL